MHIYIHVCLRSCSGYRLEFLELYIDSPSPHNMISHHIKGITVLYSYKHCVLGLLIVWTLIYRLDHVFRGIVYTVYLLDVLVESHTAQLLLDYYCTRIEVSVLSGGGGGGGCCRSNVIVRKPWQRKTKNNFVLTKP